MVADPALDERPWTRFSYQFLWPRDSLAGSHSGTWMAQAVRPDGQPVLTGGDFFARDLNAYWLLRRFRMARPTLERPSHFHIEGTRSSVSAPPEVTSRWLDLT
ncbi:hypothetical protein [Nocardioides sp. Leaf285]|uniref:hypothetical protein n=1 Tax=Nocardioides sp. Leaf285 TaxID=1736322 RepID=UPI0012EA01E4|nr:hypothetical protein [Nocardioides sp. Leaf285]